MAKLAWGTNLGPKLTEEMILHSSLLAGPAHTFPPRSNWRSNDGAQVQTPLRIDLCTVWAPSVLFKIQVIQNRDDIWSQGAESGLVGLGTPKELEMTELREGLLSAWEDQVSLLGFFFLFFSTLDTNMTRLKLLGPECITNIIFKYRKQCLGF